MDSDKRLALQQQQESIVNDLDVTFIIDKLFSDRALSEEDFNHILKLENRTDRVRFLMDTLIHKGDNNAFEVFKDSLVKDYWWLGKNLEVTDMNIAQPPDNFEDDLSRGDVPRLPEHYVKRVELENKVVSCLRVLQRHQILVCHGMVGSGKTTVAAAALRSNPDLVTTHFNSIVFWLNFGNCKTDDDIIAQQNKLYRKASSINPNNSSLNLTTSMSSIGSDSYCFDRSNNECSLGFNKDKLKTQFSDAQLKDCLLVLDEVNMKRVVESFDIGCKLMVLTRDTGVVEDFQTIKLNVENHFKEAESLQLFASCIGVDVSNLPSYAKKLHATCKGSPFHIGIIGADLADNKERLTHDPNYWRKCLSALENKQYFHNVYFPLYNKSTKNTDNLAKAIEFCINALDFSIQKYYKMFSILPHNVKVSAQVISKLWNIPTSEVEYILRSLRSKSLVTELYDQELKNYVYEIHDLIMDYLKTSVSEDERTRLHVNFLKSYHYDDADSPPEVIADDGYIAFFIGYHILRAKSYGLFNKLYLNLEFLGNKVRLTGPADVLHDLTEYEMYIAREEVDKELLDRIRKYLLSHGADLHQYPCTGLVQSVLQHESGGALYCRAVHAAQRGCARNQLYFEFLHDRNVEEIKPSIIDAQVQISSVCFLGDYVLVGTATGVIKIFLISTNKLKRELVGSDSAVLWIGPCPVNPPRVASLADNGAVSLWYIDDMEGDIGEEDEEELLNNNDTKSNITILPKGGPFVSCRWLNHSETLIANTRDTIVLYNGKGEKQTDIALRDRTLSCSVPSNNDKYIIMATHSEAHCVQVMDVRTKEIVFTFDLDDRILDILTVQRSDKIIVLKQKEVIEIVVHLNGGLHRTPPSSKCSKIITGAEIKEGTCFMCMAVNDSGSRLFLATDDSRVVCVDLTINRHAFSLENHRGNVISMCVSEAAHELAYPGPDALLTGTGDAENCAKVWWLDPGYVAQATQRNCKVRWTTRFDASFAPPPSPGTPGTPGTPSASPPGGGAASAAGTPRRNKSFAHADKPPLAGGGPLTKAASLDRHRLRPLNLLGLSNNCGDAAAPLVAVVDERNNIQIMRGKSALSEITTSRDDRIKRVQISPCGRHVVYGTRSGAVVRCAVHAKRAELIMDLKGAVRYLQYVAPGLLVAASEHHCWMAYRCARDGRWLQEMMQKGNKCLGSQEMLIDMDVVRRMNNGSLDRITSSNSINGDQVAPSSISEKGGLSKHSGLVHCFRLSGRGLITVERNSAVKIWGEDLQFNTALAGQRDLVVVCAAFQNNILVVCDEWKFLIYQFREGETLSLRLLQEVRVGRRAASCDLTGDGRLLAVGLDSGDVEVWDVRSGRRVRTLRHHRGRVTCCAFSPLPDPTPGAAPTPANTPTFAAAPAPFPAAAAAADDQPPLVLLTMAEEIVWWNITYIVKTTTARSWRTMSVVSPLGSAAASPAASFFFGERGDAGGAEGGDARDAWKRNWKGKTSKEGSGRKEMLSCIKLSGVSARRLCHDDRFSCFVTVDDAGHAHVMNVMTSRQS